MLDIDVCIMQDKVLEQSLIGNYSNAVSLEYSLVSISEETTTKFVKSLSELILEKTSRAHNKRLYRVSRLINKEEWQKYKGFTNYELKPEGMALMVPKDVSEMDAEYFGFWCTKID